MIPSLAPGADVILVDGMREGQYYNPKRAQAGLDGWTTPQIYDNVGDFLGTGFTENTNVNLSQSINGINYSFGVNNSHQNGIIPSTGMDRWGARGLVDWKINPQWNTGFSMNYSSTKITSCLCTNLWFYKSAQHNGFHTRSQFYNLVVYFGKVDTQIRAQAGCTYPNIYGLGFKRDEAGNLLLLNGLPQSSGNSQDLGNCSPDFTTGFTLGGRYKRLSLSTTWSWQQGGKMYHGTNMTLNYFGATKESLPYHEGSMVAEGIDEATGQPNTVEVNKADYYQAYYNITESGVYDTSFIKLRDLTLTYQLPKLGIFDISIYGFARNVLVWANLPNFDPESSQGNNNMSGYFERFSVPNTSSFGGGLTINF